MNEHRFQAPRARFSWERPKSLSFLKMAQNYMNSEWANGDTVSSAAGLLGMSGTYLPQYHCRDGDVDRLVDAGRRLYALALEFQAVKPITDDCEGASELIAMLNRVLAASLELETLILDVEQNAVGNGFKLGPYTPLSKPVAYYKKMWGADRIHDPRLLRSDGTATETTSTGGCCIA